MTNKVSSIKLNDDPSITDLLRTTQEVYGVSNDRAFNTWDIFSHQEKFVMRALKGIRKNDLKKMSFNLVIATGWFTSLMNRLHIDLEKAVWKRFPYLCSYCGHSPCVCKKIKPKNRPKKLLAKKEKPASLRDYQMMFERIYPHSSRTLEHAGIHLAEEHGELSEAIQAFFGTHNKKFFDQIVLESADCFSCLLAVFSSAGLDFEKEMKKFYSGNCHVCHNAPCTCHFGAISKYVS